MCTELPQRLEAGAAVDPQFDRAHETSPSRPLPPLTANASLRWDVVQRLLPADPGRVLEIGCGRGTVAARIARRASHLVAVEPDKTSFALAKANLAGLGEVHNCMSFELDPDERFDTICAFEVLEHIADDQAALTEWRAKLKPGGQLVLSVPAWQERFAELDELAGHFRRYDPAQMEALLHEAGFTDITVELYGFPAGHVLEAIRNALAKRSLAAGAHMLDIVERTAGSGRLLQPGKDWMNDLIALAARPLVWLQRLFPNRGVGLVARARKPG
ncbi:class I SAM-dependent methyltransferase [Altererythrobacter lauratis]|uniref:Class I SAM-dependent methyltransferase n=1 Tax=Alteraurantiacibacter lauratis TaxID=2054627 RepID=A0ABV7EG19_9SPHN